MKKYSEICPGVYQVGGKNLSSHDDCCVYLIVNRGESCLIDTGTGPSAPYILDNISALGVKDIQYIIATHGHIDHIGGLPFFKENTAARIMVHRLELPAIEEGLAHLTAASWYGVKYQGVKVDEILEDHGCISIGELKIHCIHSPGHTRGSISVYVDTGGKRVLFGQDIHGPFAREWGSDKEQWRASMRRLLELEADILCEGHFGVYSPAPAVRKYIESYLRQFSR